MSKRMRCCPDTTCRQISLRGNDKYYDKGGSFFCFGKLSKESVLIFKEVEHKNSYSCCIGSPLKGVIRYLVNPNDALICEGGFHAILLDYQKDLSKNK